LILFSRLGFLRPVRPAARAVLFLTCIPVLACTLEMIYSPALAFPSATPGALDTTWISGADLSFLQQIEDHGGVYRVGGTPRDALEIFAGRGIHSVRLRLWHSPSEGYNDLEKTLQMAARIDSAGLGLLLNFHYSDTWADPGTQDKPAAWEGLAFADLKDSVFFYTRDVIAALKSQNTLPEIVQIGNEITNGMLWNDGRVGGYWDTPEQWSQLGQLLDASIDGVQDALDPGNSVRSMIHIDRGADNAGCRWFYDNLLAQGIEFDLIGLSYYPWWHGTLDQVVANLADLSARYGKDIILVETAYPWTLSWADMTHNIVGDSGQLHDGYPATPEGQRAFLEDLIAAVRSAPDDHGRGVYYWAPDWITAPTLGSAWENLTLFDFTGELLGSIHAFDLGPPGAIDDLAAAPAGQGAQTLGSVAVAPGSEVEKTSGMTVNRERGGAQAGSRSTAQQGGTPKSAGDIRLTWTDPGDDIGVVGYVLYRSTTAAGPGDSLAATTETTYLDPGVAGTVGTDWFYTVRATDDAGRSSAESNTVGEFDIELRKTK